MSKHTFHIAAALSATLCVAAALPVRAEMYKWINDDGSTTYSNQLPADPSTVQELTTIATPKEPPRVAVDPAPPRIVVEPTLPKTELEAPAARAAVRSMLPQAVQDPCLTSSDRYCHQKNKGRYRPYVGYTPYESSVAEAAPVIPPARGATNGGSGGGAVGGTGRAK